MIGASSHSHNNTDPTTATKASLPRRSMITATVVRNSLAAAACITTAGFGLLDANPSLYCFHQFLQLRQSFQHRAYRRHLEGKTVWLVGASSGIGEELAYQISPYCKTLILSSRNVDQLNRVAQNCRTGNNENVVVVPLDVTSSALELEQCLLQTVLPELPNGTLDCVIYNAGVGHTSTVEDTDAATTLKMFQVNTIPPMLLTQLLLQHKLLALKSQMVFVSSVAGRMGLPLSAAYTASKHALQGFASSLQAETSSWLRVDLICPGPTETSFFANQGSSNNPKTPISNKRSPLKMPVQRCAALSMTHICRRRGGEAWIAQQPTLVGLYLNQYFPGLFSFILNKGIGPKRVSLYQQGLDLYDPSSWTGKKKN